MRRKSRPIHPRSQNWTSNQKKCLNIRRSAMNSANAGEENVFKIRVTGLEPSLGF